jgi:hypothetical protein
MQLGIRRGNYVDNEISLPGKHLLQRHFTAFEKRKQIVSPKAVCGLTSGVAVCTPNRHVRIFRSET